MNLNFRFEKKNQCIKRDKNTKNKVRKSLENFDKVRLETFSSLFFYV